mmetsp:Transcript_99982/g.282978  ORF Transcript_99982/g.282978 Transcript_99982/m.282978 type:complete len:207 (-) Transcript_99982:238-858(-)
MVEMEGQDSISPVSMNAALEFLHSFGFVAANAWLSRPRMPPTSTNAYDRCCVSMSRWLVGPSFDKVWAQRISITTGPIRIFALRVTTFWLIRVGGFSAFRGVITCIMMCGTYLAQDSGVQTGLFPTLIITVPGLAKSPGPVKNSSGPVSSSHWPAIQIFVIHVFQHRFAKLALFEGARVMRPTMSIMMSEPSDPRGIRTSVWFPVW